MATTLDTNTLTEPTHLPKVRKPRPLQRPIERLLGINAPFTITTPDHPVFKLEIRGNRWLRNMADVRAQLYSFFTRRVVFAILLGLVVGGIGVLTILNSYYYSSTGYNYTLYTLATLTFYGLTFASFALSVMYLIVGDFLFLARTVNSIDQERQSGQWDMLRITPLSERAILNAKFAAAQLQSWRFTAREYMPRIFFITAYSSFLVLWTIRYSLLDGYSFRSSPGAFASELGVLMTMALGSMIYILEPGWRMRALTAIGLAVSTHSNSGALNFLFAFFIVLFVHVVQVVFIFAPMFALPYFFRSQFSWENYVLVSWLSNTATLLMIGGLMYGFFRALRTVALEYALKRAFRG